MNVSKVTNKLLSLTVGQDTLLNERHGRSTGLLTRKFKFLRAEKLFGLLLSHFKQGILLEIESFVRLSRRLGFSKRSTCLKVASLSITKELYSDPISISFSSVGKSLQN